MPPMVANQDRAPTRVPAEPEPGSYGESRRLVAPDVIYRTPWWLIILMLMGLAMVVLVITDEIYNRIFDQLKEGIAMTIGVALSAYVIALIIGLFVGLVRSYPPVYPGRSATMTKHVRGLLHVAAYNAATLYVEMLRGLPILIVLLIVAFVLVPALRDFFNQTFGLQLEIRGSSAPSAIFALSLAYGAFISETFRAGIQSIEKGQVEAARSLGMTFMQSMRFVVLPQAVRRILPPLGNDLVAIVKDSSLVAILGVRDLTQVAKVSTGRSFRYMETYTLAAAIYLTMTIIGSLIVKQIERYMRQHER
jgi:polar amino acid transport system permease protein